MEQFGGVRIFALDSQKNFESCGREPAETAIKPIVSGLLSQMVAGLRAGIR